jgi:hypothetical protein
MDTAASVVTVKSNGKFHFTSCRRIWRCWQSSQRVGNSRLSMTNASCSLEWRANPSNA